MSIGAVIIGQGGKGSSGGAGLSTVTSNQGVPGLITAPWFVELSNGTAAFGTTTNPIQTQAQLLTGTDVIGQVELTNGTQVIGISGAPLRIDPTGTTVQPVSFAPETSGGLSGNVQQSLTTSAIVKASAGQFYGFDWFNPNAVTVYVFVYNTTTSGNAIGSATNLIYQKGLPAGAGSNWLNDFGVPCSSGIVISVSTSATSTGTPGTGLVLTTLYA